MISRSQTDSTLRIQSGKIQPQGDVSKGKPETKPAGSDQIQISPKAGEIARIKEAIKSMPDERTEKVEAIAKLVAEGKYEVKATDIAEMMLRRVIADRLS
jgi:negative regulator of flagellin synthesis FlgM